ncbi:MAG: peptidoglycan editing factor PgeF [Lamprobacter sp.]|uniref:peptidoglycan editing factor PgeF n=1 Tax=Lamprobacter sp. TaxID=3100796 RepID=UPI002B26267C|nr:peptidoglycan editing factor PgeF [Lamprobacter sp.]MEA3639996.1 peptidoglycan editing factor PgeF [Lamprobacter sp.]
MTMFLTPAWTQPSPVRAASTTRQGGVSAGAYASLNLATHVGDDPVAVRRNRALLCKQLALPVEPTWLNQVHGCAVSVYEHGLAAQPVPEADAMVAFGPGAVCAVMTADCLPVLLCDDVGSVVAGAHAGWRGLAAGVIEATVQHMDRPAARLQAWLGPAIGPAHFEVGDEVRACFCETDAGAAVAFRRSVKGRWLADLAMLARQRLEGLGVASVSGCGDCTYSDRDRFFSYRRDGVSGRMASLIWLR